MSSKRDGAPKDRAPKGRAPVNEELAREITKKEERLRRREREQHRTLYIGVGIAIGLTLLLIIMGLVWQVFFLPNRTVATVGEDRIVARDFWKRTRLEQYQLVNALNFYARQEEQFGNQGFFTQQINQLQATLASPFAIGSQTLDSMIEERVIAQEAAARGITVSDEEVDAALREEVAGMVGAVVPAQATATAEAGVTATAEAAAWTPAPTPTVDLSSTLTATVTPVPTPAPLPTPVVLTDTGYTEGLDLLMTTIGDTSGMSLEDYREVVRARLLRDKLAAAIGESEVATTEEQVHARHILISEITPTPEPAAPEGEATPTPPATEAVTETLSATDTAAITTEVAATDTAALTTTVAATDSTEVTTALAATDTADVTETVAATETTAAAPTTRTRDEAFALAAELRTRILGGEDFAALAAEYSDDESNAAEGGDLGWFGRGAMVAPFEEAAFSLPIGEVSEPISTTFGVHLIEVLEKDAERPKDEGTLEQERATAFDEWLAAQLETVAIERFDVQANLPRQLQ